jgi:pyruvate-formate lyase-activating enzyme
MSLDPKRYYRLPWTLNDNVIAWLEPTKRCNITCEGCYSGNDKKSDKSLEQIRSEMDIFVSRRRFDSVSLAGGDPLVHPDIVEIVRMVKQEYGKKPIINTNAVALTPELTRELKRAGAFGFTFHIDSRQHRPGWKGKSEVELNALRLHYAEMVAEAGGMTVSFNSTVYPDTTASVPQVIQWAGEHIDIVHGVVFILFRTSRTQHFHYYAQGRPIDPKQLIYYDEDKNPSPLEAAEVVETIRRSVPDFEPTAYLGGTKDPNSFKWLITLRVGDKKRIHGYLGPRFMEAMQVGHHLLTGRYLVYSPPSLLSLGRPLLAALSFIDPGARRAGLRYARSLLTSPHRLFAPLRLQTVAIIQPIDFMRDGEMNMCDGCPDMTVHNGELVWSCRLDERLKFGCFLTAAPLREAETRDAGQNLKAVQGQPS